MSNETALVKTETQAQEFSAFGNSDDFASVQRMAKCLSSSSIVPAAFQGEQNLGNCVIALEMSHRIGASALAVMQNIYIVHGKPGWSAQFLISCLNASQKFTPLRYRATGEKGKDSFGCIAWANDKTGEKLESPEVTIAMAKAEGWYGKNGSKWQTMPELMLRYRAATFFTRLYAPEITMGIQTTDEIGDIIDVDTSVSSPEPTKPTFRKTQKPKETVVEVAQEVSPVPPVAEIDKTPEKHAPEPHDTANQQVKSVPAQPLPPETFTNGTPAINDLLVAMSEGEVSLEQVMAFVVKKNALKEGTDKDLATLDDILGSKVSQLAKIIRTKGQAWKEMKGVV